MRAIRYLRLPLDSDLLRATDSNILINKPFTMVFELRISLDGLRIFKQTNQRVPSIIEFQQLHLSCLSQDDSR